MTPKIEVATPDALADVADAGKPLATVLRSIADRIEQDIQITPTTNTADVWTTEVYRHAERVDGVLIGAVYTLEVTS